MRDEAERLVKEALERKTLTVTQGKTRIESKCGKCGALNRVVLEFPTVEAAQQF
jgi:phage FluMu protein Com